MPKLVLTVVGDDRPGLVAALTSALVDVGGNWLESELVGLVGRFAGIALVEAPDADALRAALAPLAANGLTVTVAPADTAPEVAGMTLHVFVLGNDRPGILREVAGALASCGVTIGRVETLTRPAPMGDGLLFEADADVTVPEGVSLAAVRAALEELSADLVVDLDAEDADEQVPGQ